MKKALFILEKPRQGRALRSVIGADNRLSKGALKVRYCNLPWSIWELITRCNVGQEPRPTLKFSLVTPSLREPPPPFNAGAGSILLTASLFIAYCVPAFLTSRQIRKAISTRTATPSISAPHTSTVFHWLCCSAADVAISRASPPRTTSF